MIKFINENYKEFNSKIAENLDGLIWQFQKNHYYEVKKTEFFSNEDLPGDLTLGEFIKQDPYCIFTAYNHNDSITLYITEDSYELDVTDFDGEYLSITDEDLTKIAVKVEDFLKKH